MNLLLFKIKSFKLIRENFEKYIFIILLAFLLSRGILLDIPMSKNEEDYEMPMLNIIINSFFHAIVLTLLIFLYELYIM